MVHVGVDAQLARDFQRFFDDVGGAQIGVAQQGLGRGMRIGAARPDGHDALLGLEHVAVARDDQRSRLVGHGQHGFEAAQHAVGTPILGQLDGSARQVALVLFQLGLEALEQREGIGRGPGKAGQHGAVIEAAHLARSPLDHDVAQGDLAVAANGDLDTVCRLAADADDGGAVILFHSGAI
ncbi:hypothetical protein D3C78_1296740 [compost metagenome]